MSLTATETEELALRLHRAERTRTETGRLTDAHPDLGSEDAYRIQTALLRRRVDEGEQIVGVKLGFTSRAMQEAMGVNEPNYGWLTDAMIVDDGRVRAGELIHPKTEPEIAFVLGRDLAGPTVTAHEVLAATGLVVPALEVVDSRYTDFAFRAHDNIADNSSAAKVVLGGRAVRPDGIDLPLVGVVMWVDGELFTTAAGAAALGHPASAAAWCVRRLAAEDRGLSRGDIVLSGGLTGPADLSPGTTITAGIDRLGEVTLRVEA